MTSLPSKNIWLAAGDGDLAIVQNHIEQHGVSPNAPDSFTYTPMHAAASYGHIFILEYLISKGGDVNITDGDGDTPLYVVESLDTARWLVEHGALANHTNHEGLSPAGQLHEEYPEISAYLRSVTGESTPSERDEGFESGMHDNASAYLADQLLQSAASALAADPSLSNDDNEADTEPALRAAVTRTVLQGVLAGYGLGVSSSAGSEPNAQPNASEETNTDTIDTMNTITSPTNTSGTPAGPSRTDSTERRSSDP